MDDGIARRIHELELLKSRQPLTQHEADELAGLRVVAGIDVPRPYRREATGASMAWSCMAWAALGGATVVIACVLLLVGAVSTLNVVDDQPVNAGATMAAPTTWVTTHEFKGSAYKRTEPFSATSPWRINWSCNPSGQYASTFSVELYDPTEHADLLVNGVNLAGGDVTYVYRSGTFSLDIQSLNASWVVQVQEGR